MERKGRILKACWLASLAKLRCSEKRPERERNEDPAIHLQPLPKKRQAGRRPQINIVQHIHPQKESTDATTSFSTDSVKDDHYGTPVFRKRSPFTVGP